MEKFAEIFKALAHPIRLKIVCGLIKKKECNVSVMVGKLGLPQPIVSQHLNILKNANIVTCERKGTQICYQVTNESVKKIIEAIGGELCE